MERKTVVVAFGDLIGFGPWIKRAINAQEIKETFLQNFYSELESFILKNQFYLKYIGDGVMILKELPIRVRGTRCDDVMKFLEECVLLNQKMHKIIKECPWPAPKGFRIRAVAGTVNKIMAACPIQVVCDVIKDCFDTSKCKTSENPRVPEYIGYPVNLAERLLAIHPEIQCICHESVINMIKTKKNKVHYRHIENIVDKRGGIDEEDLAGLYSFELSPQHS